MKILAITTGQGQKKAHCLGDQLLGSHTSGQGYPQAFLSGRSAGKEDQRAREMKIHRLPTQSTPCAQNSSHQHRVDGTG